jgi:hypothetical protein
MRVPCCCPTAPEPLKERVRSVSLASLPDLAQVPAFVLAALPVRTPRAYLGPRIASLVACASEAGDCGVAFAQHAGTRGSRIIGRSRAG